MREYSLPNISCVLFRIPIRDWQYTLQPKGIGCVFVEAIPHIQYHQIDKEDMQFIKIAFVIY